MEIITYCELSEIGKEVSLSICNSPFVLALDQQSLLPRSYWKEIAYVDDFVKNAPGQPIQRFRISEPLIQHWHKIGKEMLADGVGIPMPLGHTKNAEFKRADVRDYKTSINGKGKLALYALAQFKDSQSESDLKDSNVSLYMEPESASGKGKTYRAPITHIAFTDYPVLPGLEPFKPIAASFVESSIIDKDFQMPITLVELAKKRPELKLSVDGKPEDTINALCLSLDTQMDAIAKANTDIAELQKQVKAPENKPEVKPIPAMMLSLARDNRNMKIDKLATDGKITAAVATDLKNTFTADAPLTLALSNESGTATDNFDAVYTSLDKLPVATALGNSTKLPKDSDESGDNSPIAKLAEKRAKAAAGRN